MTFAVYCFYCYHLSFFVVFIISLNLKLELNFNLDYRIIISKSFKAWLHRLHRRQWHCCTVFATHPLCNDVFGKPRHRPRSNAFSATSLANNGFAALLSPRTPLCNDVLGKPRQHVNTLATHLLLFEIIVVTLNCIFFSFKSKFNCQTQFSFYSSFL